MIRTKVESKGKEHTLQLNAMDVAPIQRQWHAKGDRPAVLIDGMRAVAPG